MVILYIILRGNPREADRMLRPMVEINLEESGHYLEKTDNGYNLTKK